MSHRADHLAIYFADGPIERAKPLPERIAAAMPESVTAYTWDAATDTLTVTYDDPGTGEPATLSWTLTEAEIDTAQTTPDPLEFGPPVTLEHWLDARGYSPASLIMLDQLERQLAAAAIVLPIAQDTRAWLDSQMARVGAGVVRTNDWTPPPHPFQDVVASAMVALAA